VRIVPTEIPDVLIVEPKVHADGRGFFIETYHAERYREQGIDGPFVQDNQSRSVAGTLRGLHLQLRRPQGKLVRVIEGEVFDVAVDVRRGSPTFGRWVSVTLTAENFKQCYVPPGFAHGFCVVSPIAQVEYKCTDFYDPLSEIGIAWNDPGLAIAWPAREPLLSARDREHRNLGDLTDRLPIWRPGSTDL
jgi:dTDP-4-dehydrorhamnose 3,5-epimerase